MYNWQNKEWANFIYNEDVIEEYAMKFAELSGVMYGVFRTFNSDAQQREIMDIMISEALKTSAIEGEMLSREDVRSSFLKKMGLAKTDTYIKDRRAENVAALMLEVRNNYQAKLSEKLLKDWHAMLFSNSKYVNAGVYRKSEEAMQIVSGAAGREKVHFEAPPSERVPEEMKKFVKWYNSFKTDGNYVKIIVKTAITHLYFESIHPFEDGNGRTGRALIEKCLSESLGKQVVMSISQTIEKNRTQYYTELQKAQITLEIDGWLRYFSQLLIEAQQEALDVLFFSVRKAQFYDRYGQLMNERQSKAVKRMMEAGKEGFEGGMTTKKYISIVRTTKSTATRDLQELSEHGILIRHSAGRSTNYVLNI
jgi:Fic family protein